MSKIKDKLFFVLTFLPITVMWILVKILYPQIPVTSYFDMLNDLWNDGIED